MPTVGISRPVSGRCPALSRLALGASAFGNLYRTTTDAESAAAVDAAWRGGIRYFDSAPHYGLGLSDRRLGAALARYPRDEYVLSTKVGRALVPSPQTSHLIDESFEVPATHRRQWDFSRRGIIESVEASLERLGASHVDILYLHDPDGHWEAASTTGIDTLIELREQGLTRAIGVGMNQSAMLTEFVRRCDIDVVMLANRYTLLEQEARHELLPEAQARGIPVIAGAVYNSGLLSRPRPAADARYNYGTAPARLVERANAIADHCERHGVTLPVAALAYPLRHPAVISVIVGPQTAAEVESNVERMNTPVPEQLWADLAAAGLLP